MSWPPTLGASFMTSDLLDSPVVVDAVRGPVQGFNRLRSIALAIAA